MGSPTFTSSAIDAPHLHLRTKASQAIDAVSVTCHGRELTGALDEQMQSLYGNVHSTLSHFRIYGGYADITHVYIARKNDTPVAIFLLQLDADVIKVINEGMSCDVAELKRFTDYAFARWPAVRAISFHAVLTPAHLSMPRPLQQYPCTADVVISLPDSAEKFVESLGKNMRRNVRRYMSKLQDRFPAVRHAFFDGCSTHEQQVRDIIALNRARITNKNLSFSIDDDEMERIMAMVRESGMTSVMTIDDRVIAGGIGYRAGDSFFYRIVAHDPAYDDFSAGILITYLTICECIARGCKEFNFMRSEYEYKFALGARTRPLHHLVVYRSRFDVLLKSRFAAANTVAHWRHRLTSLLERANKAQDLGKGERVVARVLGLIRTTKRLVAGKS